MLFLVASTVLVGAVCLLNLVLTAAVLRRLRDHEERLAGLPRVDQLPTDPGTLVGHAIADFTAVATDGSTVTRETLLRSGSATIAFFSTHCPACEAEIDGFVRRVRRFPGPRSAAVAVVAGEPGDVQELVTAAGAVATVVVESPLGPLAAQFGVRGTPTFLDVDGTGTVVRAAHTTEGMDAAPGRSDGVAPPPGAPAAGGRRVSPVPPA